MERWLDKIGTEKDVQRDIFEIIIEFSFKQKRKKTETVNITVFARGSIEKISFLFS
jgi:hypothetical protein